MLITLCLLSLTTLAQTPQPLIITTQSFPTAIAGRQYNVQLTATGGITPYHWRILEGKLPGGLQVSDSGVISGTPSEIGEFNVTLAVSDSSAPTNAVQKKFAIKSIAPMIVKWIESPQVRDQGIVLDRRQALAQGRGQDSRRHHAAKLRTLSGELLHRLSQRRGSNEPIARGNLSGAAAHVVLEIEHRLRCRHQSTTHAFRRLTRARSASNIRYKP